MKRIRFRIPFLVDAIIENDSMAIWQAAKDLQLDREYNTGGPLLNGFLLKYVLRTLQIAGRRFPTLSPRNWPGRAEAQHQLWKRLSELAPALSGGPDELQDLADIVRGERPVEDTGPLVQEVVGRLFAPDFHATRQSYEAAQLLYSAANTIKPLICLMGGKVEKAKSLIADMVYGDLAGVHGAGVAMHHIVDGIIRMREIYQDPSRRPHLNSEEAAAQCLFAPPMILRQPLASTTCGWGGRGTLVALRLEDAQQAAHESDLVFLRGTWSMCPAEAWVPALLAGVWNRARNE